jgi:hypothetical protein
MELLCASIRIEPGALERAFINGDALCKFTIVKEPEPGDPSLADFTLAVIKYQNSISHVLHQVYNSNVIRAMKATVMTPSNPQDRCRRRCRN